MVGCGLIILYLFHKDDLSVVPTRVACGGWKAVVCVEN